MTAKAVFWLSHAGTHMLTHSHMQNEEGLREPAETPVPLSALCVWAHTPGSHSSEESTVSPAHRKTEGQRP